MFPRRSCRGCEGRGGGWLPAFRLRFGLWQRAPDWVASFEQLLRAGIKREELWITSKLWNDKHGEDDVIAPAASRWPICGWTISIFTWCIGRSRIFIRRAAT